MIKFLAFFLGCRFSYGRYREGMFSLISIFSAFGVSISIAILIVSLSAMNGFERELNQRVLAVVPHCEIEPVNHYLTEWKTLLAQIERIPDVAAAAPYIIFTGLLESSSHKLVALQVRGVDALLEHRVSECRSYLKGCSWEKFLPGRRQLFIGKGVADRLNLKLGDWMTMIMPDKYQEDKLLQPKYVRLKVTGILNFNGIRDYSLAYMPIIDVQKLLSMGHYITGISVRSYHPFEVESLINKLGENINFSAYIRSWRSTYGYMYDDIRMIRAIIYLAIFLVMGIACFSIVSTLMIAVQERRYEIAILRTLGATDSLIRAIFIWYGLLLGGVVGSVIGVSIGVLVSLKITVIIHILEKLIGCDLLSGEIYFIDFLPSELHWFDIISVLFISLVLSLVATWYPAKQASRLQPVQILRRQ
ncbi:lipoprotein-releasing ABC transporter permease subunit LolE [Candidatus Erwinia haradaeae]|uniref:Lipoprotein-releasing system transmembrane protein LolE n=1 Tax=Candidatus Erwinia haradaeae TaxID=1922217 RepID=A0A451D372_9GAMM|nr:lipoprotein-releasing ABC transporter permease subunit LolE [Candidatus Erwinia haradaeae]VFP80106.1 Lipoprotein-releasing system transmembrane protein LolE [Candidatus Erwinia haradaeae]